LLVFNMKMLGVDQYSKNIGRLRQRVRKYLIV